MSKPKIEAIYPLTFMQQTLLFHHLHEQYDQGFLHVQCTLEGRLDPQLLEEAFAATVRRHHSLRTSIHWENIAKPVQIVHPDAVLPFVLHDWRSDTRAQQSEKLTALKSTDRKRGFDLSVAPLSSITLIRLADDQYVLLWNCHHILLDGWSAAMILNDAFRFYDALCNGKDALLAPLPDYRTYLNWVHRQDLDHPREFWKRTMAGYNEPALLATVELDANDQVSGFREDAFSLSEERAAELNAYARRHQLTISTLIQGLWAIVLGRCLERRDVVIGTTVSGRSAPIPNLELTTGLFMNVLPLRIRIAESISLSDWLKDLQRGQAEARSAEFVTLDQILTWTGWSGRLPLFDTLLVVENFPFSELRGGDVVLKSFAGGFTSTYPVTIVVKPGPRLEIVFRFQTDRVPDRIQKFLTAGMRSLLTSIDSMAEHSVSDLWTRMNNNGVGPDLTGRSNGHRKSGVQNVGYVSPRNTAELKLTAIWEEIFGHHPIGVREDFFHLGGSSLQAVRMFAKIEKKLGKSLPPAALMQNRTIESLALLVQDEQQQTWNSLVPIRAGGSKLPLFCVHAGGAHVLFYHALARHLGSDQPVYALQPAGLDGHATLHKSIEEMASTYVQEIRKVQLTGPYAILGTCFGNAVCLEMARQLQTAGQSISLLAIIDSGVYNQEHMVNPTRKEKLKRIPLRYERFTERFRKNPFKAILGIFRARYTRLRVAMEKRFNFLRSRQTRALYIVQKHLLHLHLQYGWAPYEGKVTLIRSSESTENPNLDAHLTQWSKLARNGVDVFVVPGHHETIFQEPEVEHLARQVNECLAVNEVGKEIISLKV